MVELPFSLLAVMQSKSIAVIVRAGFGVTELVLATLLRRGHRFSLIDAREPGYSVRSTTVGPQRPMLRWAISLCQCWWMAMGCSNPVPFLL